jgi:hypothetical protein
MLATVRAKTVATWTWTADRLANGEDDHGKLARPPPPGGPGRSVSGCPGMAVADQPPEVSREDRCPLPFDLT